MSTADSAAAHGHLTGGQHWDFQARDAAMVDFHAPARAHGGRSNGPPSPCPDHPAFVLDSTNATLTLPALHADSPHPPIDPARAPDRRQPACIDPFIFGAYHQDHYPAGNGQLGPDPALVQGGKIGMDFSRRQGWSMCHEETVPGFPAHPHRNFETVTIVRQSLVDHADSLGAWARYGQGDVQWLTTVRGVQHGEMFPPVHENQGNTLDLFQRWLNLPAKSKMVAPVLTMFWGQDIQRVCHVDANGRRAEVEVEVEVVAGDYQAFAPDGTLQHAKALSPHQFVGQRTEFGCWPWPRLAQTFGTRERFAQHPDGRLEAPQARTRREAPR